ncbi:MAG: hypothetical protein ABI045_04965 [Flavobacteriales bacterium]
MSYSKACLTFPKFSILKIFLQPEIPVGLRVAGKLVSSNSEKSYSERFTRFNPGISVR